ncbi:MAG TPA: hypothetical protein DCW74_17175 [Alteromonas australica]|uniref:Recombinase RecT n=1 Tax=Alteromonas australica TaxID=589873 RepID=A0A350P836_9ALTE|nr:hypothetical protein [Alteromonas australica]
MNQPNWSMTAQQTEQQQNNNSLVQLNNLFELRKPEFATALKDIMTPDYFRRLVMTAMTSNPKLARCSQASIYESALTSAQLGLEPNTPLGEAYLIPYGNKCSFQIGRNGWIKLAYRTGLVKYVNALPVYEGEEFVWQPGNDPEVIHKPDVNIDPKAELITAYAWVVLNDGTRVYEVLRKRDWQKIRAATKGNGPGWKEYPERMICRSALKRLIRTRLPVNEFFVQQEPVPTVETKPEPVEIDESTGEILTPQAKFDAMLEAELVSQADDKGVRQDGAEQKTPARDDAESNIKLTAEQFWNELKALCEFWKQSFDKDQVKHLIKQQYGENVTLSKLNTNSRHEVLNTIERMFKENQLLMEEDNVSY